MVGVAFAPAATRARQRENEYAKTKATVKSSMERAPPAKLVAVSETTEMRGTERGSRAFPGTREARAPALRTGGASPRYRDSPRMRTEASSAAHPRILVPAHGTARAWR